ncbi:GTP-binding signal recognition particle SRP54, G- domain protein [Thermogladius calderae 1633]|uniref:Signal recognition particle 54 kDa protein n=1 Tax=Thermogladius calderae (strain DSM 22663 / VKM B-2946 / 1633) TaxID=1184251 RepID=I3TDS6_THEC1|nr:signal recognition particle protein Srp54 [Thermogladius calderae]AFK50914.1 GTP-binding signal recognition particle SRP54, G- domain protein [Thermogladius calderae 1633]
MVLDGLRRIVRNFIESREYETSVNEFVKELQKELIRSDVNVRLVMDLTKKIKERAAEERPPPGLTRRDWFLSIVYEQLVNLFGGPERPQVKPPKKPWVVLLVGLQGSGKTTTAGKLAYFYKLEGYKVGLVAADTFRPGAYEQLKTLGEAVGVPVYGEPGSKDAVSIAVKGVEFFREKGFDVIIIDTAGRHHREEDLLAEMEDIAGRVRPDEVVLVLDASIGQQAFEVASKFHNKTPVGSIIVTKLDGTAKGGGALSAVAATGARIKFVGTGEKIDELEVFDPKRFVARIMGLGDLEGLLERVKKAKVELSEKDVEDILEGRVNMRIVYKQLVSLRKMGPLRKILEMIPGLQVRMPVEVDSKTLEEKMEKWLAAINSMTYEELDNPEVIDKSRVKRISYGAGVDPEDVKALLKQYEAVKSISKQLKRQKNLLAKMGLDTKKLGELMKS